MRIGAKTGRLPSALESLSSALSRIQDMRRTLNAALLYPVIVAVLAYTLLVSSLLLSSPPVIAALQSENVEAWWLDLLRAISQNVWLWAPIPPILALIWVGYCLLQSANARFRRDWESRHVRWGRMACLTECLAMLLERKVSVAESLTLSTEVFGDRKAIAECEEFAGKLEQGEDPAQAEFPKALPPLVRWMLANRTIHNNLPAALKDLARQYHSRALWQLRWYRTALPVWLSALVGGSGVLVYGTVVLGPWVYLLYKYGVTPPGH